MDSTASFGAWLRRRRRALDLTQDELARQVGCALGTLKKLETDERRPSKQLAERLADCLAIPSAERAAFLKAARAELAVDRLDVALPPGQLAVDLRPTPLPTGTVTFLFTDIEGSTALWERHRQAMREALARHEAMVRQAIEARGGVVFKTIGDAVCAAFSSAPQALAAALDAQRALQAEDWGALEALRVRMALHTGTAELEAGDYAGFALSRVARILAAGHGGQVLLSQSTQELVRNHLPPGSELRDLGAHRLKDLTQPERIFQAGAPGLPPEFPPLSTVDTRPTNLPAQPTALIGRERQIADVCALLRRDDMRLLTLTGPGGTGKTRLALQAAAELLDDDAPAAPLPSQRKSRLTDEGLFPDGVWFVNLAPISDPGLIATTIAHALGVVEVAGKPIEESLRAFLRAKRTLLLLDNFEQVLEAAPRIAELLSAAPGLKVLITSRAVLHLYGEHEFAVPPLALPPPTAVGAVREPPLQRSVAELTQYEAVRLFIARAQAAKADFAVTNANAPAVAEICHRLDGLPLAIELAAARAKLFPPEALLARLEYRLQVLTGGPRDLPQRQQTLRNTIEWSYNLLDASEQALFARLSVFVDGYTLEAAQALRNVDGDLPLDVVDCMASLTDKSLLRQVEGSDGAPRFVMLETVREYALERLEASGEAEAIRRRHAEYFLALAEAAERQLNGLDVHAWHDRLEADHNNLRAALEWSLEIPIEEAQSTIDDLRSMVGLRLAAALAPFWRAREHLREGFRWLERVLVADRGPATRARVKVLCLASSRATDVYNWEAAQALGEEGLALARDLEDTDGIAWSLVNLGFVAVNREDFATARGLYEESMALDDDRSRRALALSELGHMAHHQGDYSEAAARSNQSLALFRILGDKWGMTLSLGRLGLIARALGDYAHAATLYEEQLALLQELDDRRDYHWTLWALGSIAQQQGDNARASAHFAECLAWFHRNEDQVGIAACLEGLAGVAGTTRQPVRVVRLFGAAAALRDAVGSKPFPDEKEAYDRQLAAAREQLGEDVYVAAWAAGRALTLEQAIAEALGT